VLDIAYTEPMDFSYWAPLGSGGFVVSHIEQHTEFNFDANVRYIQEAERTGFRYALMPARYFVSHGWPSQFEAVTTSAGLTQVTSEIHILSALHPGLWHPGIVAKMGATIDHMSGGRWGLNVTTGWFKDEFIGFGEPWLDHDERYRRSEEFIRVLTGLWTEDVFTFAGDFYRIREAPLRPKPLAKPRPKIFQGGNSMAARRMAARVSNLMFINGHTLEEARAIAHDTKEMALAEGRVVRGVPASAANARDDDQLGEFGCGLNCFVICRDSEEEARAVFDEIVEQANWEAINAFKQQVKGGGASSAEGVGMWAQSKGTDFVQQNDGFRPDLIGTPEQIAEKIEAIHSAGIDMIQCGFLHYDEDLAAFGEKVIPLVREREQRLEDGEDFIATSYESHPSVAPARLVHA
jgi:FMNH2-dependent dimethyl sulfone monooxygenase